MEFKVYMLYKHEMQPDWSDVSDPGVLRATKTCIDKVVVNSCFDKMCIGGYGSDGKYWQFDSEEAHYSYGWFIQNFNQHGLWLESMTVKAEIIDGKFTVISSEIDEIS